MNRSKLFVISGAFLVLAFFVGHARADVILSITFTTFNSGPNITSSNPVGAPVESGAAADNWNNVENGQTLNNVNTTNSGGNFVDSDGNTVSSSFNFDLAGNGTRQNNQSNPEAKIIQRNGTTVPNNGDKNFVLTNTASLFTTHGELTTFDLYVYLIRFDPGNTLTVELDSDASISGSATYVDDATTDTDFIAGEDYLVVSGLQASSGDLEFDAFTDAQEQGIGAFQIVETGFIPEPASLALLGVGAILMVRRPRRPPEPVRAGGAIGRH